eukprot:TRINITY_DN45004_c1_g1_i1.p1 TRINITY_DN45004_c1_g1~~TRINITY_DN45004_c1_g1_i1.p1  ORF type:complete len:315 (+),score=13.80 TRINITY_DN45004_c1_g1_i1:342-1286(+)
MGNGSSKEGVTLKDSGSSRNCSVYLQPGLKSSCQDSVLVLENPLRDGCSVLAGVFDGHGLSGHFVSAAVRDQLPARLQAALEAAAVELQHVAGSAADDLWAQLWSGVFHGIDDELKKDLFHNRDSGSTAVAALRRGPEFVLAHVGDSRCVLARKRPPPSDNGSTSSSKRAPALEAVQLTMDHKASNPVEKARVQEAGGKVMNFMNTVDRIFLPGKNEPGLAVSRAFGDFDLKGHGLICRPEVLVRTVEPTDEFIVMASDGVWDVLKNTEVVEIVANAWPRSKAAKLVAQKAVANWAKEKHANSRDDISVVVVFF